MTLAIGFQDRKNYTYIALLPGEEAQKWANVDKVSMTLGIETIKIHWFGIKWKRLIRRTLKGDIDEGLSGEAVESPFVDMIEDFQERVKKEFRSGTIPQNFFRYQLSECGDEQQEINVHIGNFVNFLMSRGDGEIIDNLLILDRNIYP